MKKCIYMICFGIIFLGTSSFASMQQRSFWIDLKPQQALFWGADFFPGIALDANFSVQRHLIKLTGAYADDDLLFEIDFTTPARQLTSLTVSYGYIFNTGKVLYTVNLAIGRAHYVARGNRIEDTSSLYMNWITPTSYEKIEHTGTIFKFPASVHYRFADAFALGAFVAPFIVDGIAGIEAGLAVSLGYLWKK